MNDSKGYILLHRKCTDDDIYFEEKFTRWQAWVDLIFLACYKPRTLFIRGNKINLEIGQLAVSQKELASRWQWSNKKVIAYLDFLVDEEKITIKKYTAVINIISITNYKKYQITTPQTTPQTTPPRIQDNTINTSKEYNIKKYSPKGEYKEIADMWHSICTSLPKVRMITDARRAKIKTRLGEFGDDPMATLRTIFEKIQASDFCKGDNDRHWQADFDWVFENDTNWVKVVEGKYDNTKPPKVPIPPGVKLGVGEYITPDGRRTYGIGRANVPLDAPPRGYDDLIWDSGSQRWVPYV